MDAIIFIARTLLQVLLVTIFLLRVLLPLARADSRNQLSQAVIRLTNPLVLPLRRVLPPIGQIDTASLVALILVEMATIGILWLLGAFPLLFSTAQFLQLVLFNLLGCALQFYTFALILFAVLSWVAPGTYSPAAALLSSLCEPLLRPVRKLIPHIAGIDVSALLVIIALQALYIAIRPWLYV
jgi:YggT family protein